MSSSRIGIINVVGLYSDVDQASRATYRLTEHGFSRGSLSVMTSTPFPHGAFAVHTGRSYIPYLSLLGGAGGILLGLAFAAGTALLYPLPTGGKPIVAWPSVGVITYEFTMLSIIIMTLLGFLFFARLPKRKPRNYLPAVTDGMVQVVVPCRTEERAALAERMLQETGAAEVRRLDASQRRWDEI